MTGLPSSDAGCVAVSDDGKPVMNSLVMRRALEYAQAFALTVVDHCECLQLSDGGCMHEGLVATELGLHGVPAAAEDIMVARNLALAELTGGRPHPAPPSPAGSVPQDRGGQGSRGQVTSQGCPAPLSLAGRAGGRFNN